MGTMDVSHAEPKPDWEKKEASVITCGAALTIPMEYVSTS